MIFVSEGMGGWGYKGTRTEMMALSSGTGGARLCRPHEGSDAVMVKDYGITVFVPARPGFTKPRFEL